MHSNAHYHAVRDDDDTDLWDQLNDQQSREVQQHQSRFQATPPYSRSHPGNIFVSMAQSSAERVGTSVVSAWDAAHKAWDQYPHRSTSMNSNTDLDLDQQFGIQDLRPTNFEEGQQNPNSPFVVLSNFPRQAIASARDHWGIVANMDVFLQHLYQYYYHRGLFPMICKFLVEFTSLIFT